MLPAWVVHMLVLPAGAIDFDVLFFVCLHNKLQCLCCCQAAFIFDRRQKTEQTLHG